MKKLMLSTVLLLTLVVSTVASAATNHAIAIAQAYPKGSGSYDMVVRETPGTSLKLYTNDAAPVSATANKQGWATFHRVKLGDRAKVSFSKVVKSKAKTYEKTINYSRYVLATSTDGLRFVTVMPSAPIAVVPTPSPTVAPVAVPAPTPPPATPAAPVTPAASPPAATNLSNNNSYVNSEGNSVHSPAASTDGSVPAGATAQCRDGSYSFSQSRRGTCSSHGGVGNWL